MNNIKKYRKIKFLSQSGLAQRLKVKQNTISQWENNIRMPNVKQAIDLANVLGTTVEELYK